MARALSREAMVSFVMPVFKYGLDAMMVNKISAQLKAALLALILAWMAPALGHAKGSGEVLLAQDLALEAKAAETARLPILVMYSRPNCGYCTQVLREFLEPMQRNAEYRDKVIMRVVKAGSRAKLRDFSGGMTTHGDFARENGVGMVPAIHLYDSWGAPLAEPLVGLTTPDYYGGFLDQRIDEALAKVRGTKKK
jgi:thioredoxin-related protein